MDAPHDAQATDPEASLPSGGARQPVQRRARRRRWWLPAALLAPVVLAGCQVPTFGAPRGSTTQGRDAFKLWQGFFVAGIVVGGVVLALILWAAFRYRHRSEETPRQTQYRHIYEIFYTVLPILVVAGLFVFTVITENEVDATPKAQVTIDVTAFQWGWQFYYPSTGKVVEGETTQSPQMEVPVNETVTIRLRSADVIHGFYVKDFDFSRYAQPGVTNVFNLNVLQTGVYRGQCTQLCGLYHSLMLFSVKAVSSADFDAWVTQVPGHSASIGQLKAQTHAQGPGA